MALPRDFKETVAARVQNDPAFAQTLLDEVSSVLTAGSVASFILIDPARFVLMFGG